MGTFTSTGSGGNWTDDATWAETGQPAADGTDHCIISAGDTVTLTGNTGTGSIKISGTIVGAGHTLTVNKSSSNKPFDHDGVIDILNGQKIVSFYRNIMGDDTCTIDGHARNIAYAERVGLTDDKTNIGVKEYRTLQADYVSAAKRTRVNGRALKAFELQAITWVTWRRIHNIK